MLDHQKSVTWRTVELMSLGNSNRINFWNKYGLRHLVFNIYSHKWCSVSKYDKFKSANFLTCVWGAVLIGKKKTTLARNICRKHVATYSHWDTCKFKNPQELSMNIKTSKLIMSVYTFCWPFHSQHSSANTVDLSTAVPINFYSAMHVFPS